MAAILPLPSMRILVTGASGTGTTTLGRALAHTLGCAHLDADHYYWIPTDPPFRDKRDRLERRVMMEHDLVASPVVVSGSVMDWGSKIEDAFDLIVFLTLASEIRISRLHARELAAFGKVDQKFLDWAAQYDSGTQAGRSRLRHERWLAMRKAPVLRIDGDLSVEERVRRVLEATRPAW
jgi:adenylate kinase family enzyme